MDTNLIFNSFLQKNLTIGTVLDTLQTAFDEYREKREDFYIQQFKKEAEEQEFQMEDVDLDQQADILHEKVIKDYESHAKSTLESLMDKALDAINDKTIDKSIAEGLLIILTAAKKAFEAP